MSGFSIASLLLGAMPAHGYVITYDLASSWGNPPAYAANANSFFITDTFDLYSSTRWEIHSVEQQADGSIRGVGTYDWSGWDGYESSLYGGFEFLPESGDDDIESVIVDAWAIGYLEVDRVQQRPVAEYYGPIGVSFRSPFGNMHFGGSAGGSSYELDYFFGTHELPTNTRYTIRYDSFFYVETTPETFTWNSWDDFNLFVDRYGYFGETYNRVRGVFQHGFVVRSVPEPGTAALLSLGLLGIGFASRRSLATRRHLIPKTKARSSAGTLGCHETS